MMSVEPLALQPKGDFVCRTLSAEGEALLRLKRFGICEDRPVTVLQPGDPMILLAAGAQCAVSRQLAASVLVTQVTDEVETPS